MPPLCRETQSLGQQMLNAPVGINGLILICPVGVFLMAANVFGCCVSVFMCLDAVSAFLCVWMLCQLFYVMRRAFMCMCMKIYMYIHIYMYVCMKIYCKHVRILTWCAVVLLPWYNVKWWSWKIIKHVQIYIWTVLYVPCILHLNFLSLSLLLIIINLVSFNRL